MDNKIKCKKIIEQMNRTFYNIEIVMKSVSNDECWNYLLDENPVAKHFYHMLHSLDRWFINPSIYDEPDFHVDGLNNLNVVEFYKPLTYKQMLLYFLILNQKYYVT